MLSTSTEVSYRMLSWDSETSSISLRFFLTSLFHTIGQNLLTSIKAAGFSSAKWRITFMFPSIISKLLSLIVTAHTALGLNITSGRVALKLSIWRKIQCTLLFISFSTCHHSPCGANHITYVMLPVKAEWRIKSSVFQTLFFHFDNFLLALAFNLSLCILIVLLEKTKKEPMSFSILKKE